MGKVFKVFDASDGKLHSYTPMKSLRQDYAKGLYTYPRFSLSKLYAFESLEAAEAFRLSDPKPETLQTWECEAEGVVPSLGAAMSGYAVLDFWHAVSMEKLAEALIGITNYDGAVWCDRLKPVKQIVPERGEGNG